MNVGIRSCPLLIAALCPLPAQGYAYTSQEVGGEIKQNQTSGIPIVWQSNQVSFHPAFGSYFNNSARQALEEWSAVGTRLQWQVGGLPKDPCDHNDGTNTGGWSNTPCGGSGFGDALAITMHTYRRIGDGLFYQVDTDMVFDSTRAWDIYSGELRSNNGVIVYDFHRVILHELGHAAGLDHPDEANPSQNIAAVMNSKTGNIDRLQDDDKLGLASIYAVNNNNSNNPPAAAAPAAVSGGSGGGGGAMGWLLLPLLWCGARKKMKD